MFMLAQSPFDILAETYDSDFTRSEIGMLQRNRVWVLLNKILQAYNRPLKILEINCGTGEDALRLAALGHTVVATDASEVMLEKATQKLYASKINSSNISFVQCRFNELAQNFQNEEFDLVFSNFGGLNCIDKNEVKQLSKDLSTFTGPDSHLLLVVMGDLCAWEILYYSLRGKFRKAFRRQKRSVQLNVNGTMMPVYYYSPSNLTRLFYPLFKQQGAWPVGLFIPPSYLEKEFLARKQWLQKLNRWEDSSGKYVMLSRLADHFCIVLKKG
jgi:SAM-dependent methyltransferase